VAPLRVDLDTSGIAEAYGELSGIARRAREGKAVFDRFARWLMASERTHLQRGPFTPLDPDTIRQKGNARPLHASGLLEAALTVWRAPGQKLSIRDESMTFGLKPNGDAFYGAFHQYGRSVPVRKPLDVPYDAERRLADFLLDHLMGA
jgi:hypothetical protein